jgi:hypothetical protein
MFIFVVRRSDLKEAVWELPLFLAGEGLCLCLISCIDNKVSLVFMYVIGMYVMAFHFCVSVMFRFFSPDGAFIRTEL